MQTRSPIRWPLPRFLAWLRRSPSSALLVAQAIALVLYPFAGEHRGGHLFATLLSVGVLALAIRMVDQSPRKAWVAGLFAVLGVALWQVYVSNRALAVGVAGGLCYAAAYLYSAWALIGYLMQDDHATPDEIWAAGATFMLFVEAYAWLFMVLQLAQPGAFVIAGAPLERTWMELVFAAGTNFSNTGLSDVAPGTPHARALLLLGQWNGVMYLAIVLSRLAGMLRPGARDR